MGETRQSLRDIDQLDVVETGRAAGLQTLVLALEAGVASINGQPIEVEPGADPRRCLIAAATAQAATIGAPVRVLAPDPGGTGMWEMIAAPDGTIQTVAGPSTSPRTPPRPERSIADHPNGDLPGAKSDAGAFLGEDQPPQRDRRRHRAAPPATQAPWYLAPTPTSDSDPAVAPTQSDADLNDDELDEDDPHQDLDSAAGLVHAGSAVQPARTVRPRPARQWPVRSPHPNGARRVPGGPRVLWAAAVGIVVVLAAVGFTAPFRATSTAATGASPATSAAVTATATLPSTGPATSSGPTGPAKSVPALNAPPGYRSQPAWAAPIATGTKIAIAAGGVFARTPEGQVVRLDAATGQAQWVSDTQFGPDWRGPWLSRIEGQQVVAVSSATTLAYWPLSATLSQSPSAKAAIVVKLPPRSSVNWTGSSPLITSTGRVGVIQDVNVAPVELPQGSRALVADGPDVLAVRGNTWLRVSGGAVRVNPFAPPNGASGAPIRVEAISARYLLSAWPKVGDTQPITLIDTGTGQVLLQGRLPADIDITHAPLVRQISGPMTAVGPVVVDTDLQRVNALSPQYMPISLTQGHVYATSTGARKPADIRLTATGAFNVVPFQAASATVPFAAAATDQGQVALALVPVAAGWVMVGLPSV